MANDPEQWDIEINPRPRVFTLGLREVWEYRDLLILLVRRDVVAMYKQTILGPLWFFIQPLLTTVVFTLIFGNLAKLDVDGMPPFLFYLSGQILWLFFSENVQKTSGTFVGNASLFGKVYFPRLVVPIAVVTAGVLKLLIQFGVFIVALFIYGYGSQMNLTALLFPVWIIIAAMIALSLGILISSLTTRYRDLLMYVSPVIWPLSKTSGWSKYLLLANPMTPLIEAFRYGFTGHGVFNWFYIAYSFCFGLVLLLIATWIFQRVEKRFMDTV
jgi:lipopolysaccharide transport system permease protein